ncbi:hypothetical protein OUZ56_024248 [Daphnia magna]|uniref:Uncharacterized protein n=1 Tax=Daphnia magna TaxID=35525 RepID=A0ABR0B0F7_9CRUS|nr:hypothetical protein OUZ56_024248 [Daphnia magna]
MGSCMGSEEAPQLYLGYERESGDEPPCWLTTKKDLAAVCARSRPMIHHLAPALLNSAPAYT